MDYCVMKSLPLLIRYAWLLPAYLYNTISDNHFILLGNCQSAVSCAVFGMFFLLSIQYPAGHLLPGGVPAACLYDNTPIYHFIFLGNFIAPADKYRCQCNHNCYYARYENENFRNACLYYIFLFIAFGILPVGIFTMADDCLVKPHTAEAACFRMPSFQTVSL